jgi:hypothetical protein
MAETPTWPELTYLDIGQIVDAVTDEVVFDMSEPDKKLGERVCAAFNCHDELISALTMIADIGEGSGTANSLPHIAKIARAALAKARAAS